MNLSRFSAIFWRALAAGVFSSANVVMASPIPLPSGPIYIQYNNAEQFSVSNSIATTTAAGAAVTEGNWGIVQVSSMQKGTVLAPTGSDIQGGGTTVFADGLSGGQITGIFWGVQIFPGSFGTRATSGFMDLYWQDATTVNVGAELASGANLVKRTDQNHYTGFTTGTFLLRLAFAGGCDPTFAFFTICTAVDPTTTDGTAKSYQNVDLSAGGLWASALDTEFFTLNASNGPLTPPADVRTDSNFSRNGGGAWDVGGTDIIGLRSNDPVRAYVPEPDTLALLGIALLALVGLRRKSAA